MAKNTKLETPPRHVQAILNDLFSSYSNELQSKVARLDEILGRSHWLSVGTYKESILSKLIAHKIPKRFEVGTGFVMSSRGANKILSRQIDILIWDSYSKSPIFRDGDFVIIPPEACRGAIAVKSTLDHDSLSESISNLDSIYQFSDHADSHTSIFKAVFAYQIAKDVIFPDSIHNALHKHYIANLTELDQRLQWMHKNIGNQFLPWINCISCLEAGTVSMFPSKIGEKYFASYQSKRVNGQTENDTYGLLERQIVASLLVGSEYFLMRMNNPGMNQIFSYFQSERFSESWSLIPKQSKRDISSLWPFTETHSKSALDTLFSQRKPYTRAKRA